jgi:hypothetical protein
MFARCPDFDLAANRVCLAIAALAAIACLATIHRAILAGVLARRLVRRQRSRANDVATMEQTILMDFSVQI